MGEEADADWQEGLIELGREAGHNGVGVRPECQKYPKCTFAGRFPIYCECLEIEGRTMSAKARR